MNKSSTAPILTVSIASAGISAHYHCKTRFRGCRFSCSRDSSHSALTPRASELPRAATSQQSIFVVDVAPIIVRALVSVAIDRSDKFRFGIRHCTRLAQTLPAQKCNTFPDILYGLAPPRARASARVRERARPGSLCTMKLRSRAKSGGDKFFHATHNTIRRTLHAKSATS